MGDRRGQEKTEDYQPWKQVLRIVWSTVGICLGSLFSSNLGSSRPQSLSSFYCGPQEPRVSNENKYTHQRISKTRQIPKLGEDNEWKDVQKKDTNNRPSETRNRRKTRNKIINKTSYFLFNSLNKSLNQKWKLMINPERR